MLSACCAVAGALDDLAPEPLDLVAAMSRKLSSSASPDSSCSLSIRSVFGRASGLPCSSKLRNSARRPFSSVVDPSSFSRRKPEM